MPSIESATTSRETGASLWAERLALAAIIGLYIWLFTPDNPNGDGWIYIDSINTGAFNWNPNHLYMQPTGLAFAKLLAAFGFGLPTFHSLKVLSALASIAGVLLFHAALAAAPFRQRPTRLLASLGLFFSAHYLSLSLAEEFFVIQMPLLGAIFLALVTWLQRRQTWLLVASGALLAMVNGFQINSAFLAVLLGLYVAWESRGERGRPLRNLLAVWVPGIAVGVPLVLLPYVLTSRHEGLVTWLTSYQGRGGNDLGALYGIELTPVGIVKSAATLVYGFTISLAGLGDLGTVAEAVARGRQLEFRPNVPLLVSTTVLFVLLGLGVLGLVWWWLRRGRRLALGRFAMVWIAGYLIFNFLWVDTADQFWAPILPGLWLAIALWIDGEPTRAAQTVQVAGGWRRPALVLGVLAALLAVANTGTVALYRAYTSVDHSRTALLALMKPGDMIITTGWDDIGWFTWDAGLPFEKVALMPLALQGRAESTQMKQLPARIQEHLALGRRVLVARVFELDREARPWEQMARLGWPRRRVVGLLGGFRRQSLGEIGGIRIDALTADPGVAAR